MRMNVLHRGFLIFVVGISLTLPCLSQTKKLKLTVEDKSQIVKSILNQFFEDYPDVIESDEIVLSTLNISSSRVPKQSRVKLVLLNPDEVNAKANREGFVDYLVFSKFKVKGLKVLVTLENLRIKGNNPEIIPVFGHGFMWEGRRKSGIWMFECVNTTSFITNMVTTGSGINP